MKSLSQYNQEQIKNVNKSALIIHWWNFGKKTLSFKGTAEEWMKKNNIKVKFTETNEEYRILKVKVSANIGRSEVTFTANNYEDAVKQIIMFQLTYLGDKSKFVLGNREYSNNFHR